MADPNDLSLFGMFNSANFKVKRTKKFELLRKKENYFSQKRKKKKLL